MQTIETSDPIEMRRAKQAQFIGRTSDLRLNGSVVHGLVVAVTPNETATSWAVRLVIKSPPASVKRAKHRYTC